MIKKLAPLIATLWLTACGEPEIPESYGVYARLTNGDLVVVVNYFRTLN